MGGQAYDDVITEFLALIGFHLISIGMKSLLIIGVNRIIRVNLKKNQSLVRNGPLLRFSMTCNLQRKKMSLTTAFFASFNHNCTETRQTMLNSNLQSQTFEKAEDAFASFAKNVKVG